MAGKLTLVGTPIGNLSDFSPRAVEALRECDFIAAEDTRVTLRLLNHFGIHKTLVSYYEHNKRDRGAQLIARLEAGENAVLVSDAGDACDLRSGRRLGSPLPRAADLGRGGAGAECGDHRAGGVRAADRPVYL